MPLFEVIAGAPAAISATPRDVAGPGIPSDVAVAFPVPESALAPEDAVQLPPWFAAPPENIRKNAQAQTNSATMAQEKSLRTERSFLANSEESSMSPVPL
jgi:hypothetical protein